MKISGALIEILATHALLFPRSLLGKIFLLAVLLHGHERSLLSCKASTLTVTLHLRAHCQQFGDVRGMIIGIGVRLADLGDYVLVAHVDLGSNGDELGVTVKRDLDES